MTPDPELDAQIAAAIEPWLAHMRWRKDFVAWRQRRIRQEDYQAERVVEVRAALGGQFASKRVLDLGSGMGGGLVALRRAGLDVVGLDYNPAYCRIAQLRGQRYGLRLPLTVGAGEHLPFPAGTFDGILCLDVLEHVQAPARVLAEMRRVLRPGGVVLTTVPNRFAFRDPHYHLPGINWLPRPLAERLIRLLGHGKTEGSQLTDRQALSELHTYTWGGFARLAQRHGFRAVDAVEERLGAGEVRQLRGPRRRLLDLARRLGLWRPLYALYRWGWAGTYQIRLVKV
jgi:SAM-dependent methyltransferase